jgi:hypothetical protein
MRKSEMSEISQRYGMERREVDEMNRVDTSGVEKGRILLTVVVTETEDRLSREARTSSKLVTWCIFSLRA